MATQSDKTFLDVVVIGAGLGGICAAVKLREHYPHATLGVFEKNARIGGTWAKNTYPGLRCDIPSQLYSYSFAPNPNWSTTYASQPEILSYIEHVAAKHGVAEYIRPNQECLGATWSDEKSTWDVQFRSTETNTIYTIQCRILIASVGFLDIPRGPEDIAGIQDFRGEFIPWLVENAGVARLTQVVRSAHWIAPKVDREIGRAEKWILSKIPWLSKARRWILAVKFDLAFAAFRNNRLGRFLCAQLERSLKRYMQQTAPSRYHDLLIPTFSFGAKRPNDEDIPADIIILANGLKTQSLLAPMRIEGRDGAILADFWHGDRQWPAAYMGVADPAFPNLFMITGPNTLPLGHSTLLGIEHTVHYILRVIHSLLRGPARRIEVRAAAHDQFNSGLERRLDGLVLSGDVRNWYVDERTRRNTLVWPGTQLEFWISRCVRRVRCDDWEMEE
ncbi:hypothetical protein BJX62DRAFT_236093 [Aspergillus germanicus]